ncbi:hypothetical protein T4B_3051 [Trichinella pseudospiralis]|uniref:Uncharacterized protein n=1 Tax=Trichinella pseudospiralis TaxID=6337 RepID=A0A0V1JJ25_TRIPS|nr:hypothetical protein T4A_9006 [Trichinella pseudospiralis]KRZ34972.1 hypothetical protein T4B_3051 [Trichinella pseudospiralis]
MIPAHAFFGFPTQSDRRLRCSGDTIVLSKRSRSFGTKTGWTLVTAGMCFSPFGLTKVVAISIFLPHSSRSRRRHPRNVLTIRSNRLNRHTALV